jgi:hypothetical protein
MLVNVEKLKEVIWKSTVNYLISSVQLNVDDKQIESSMLSDQNDVISILKLENNGIFTGVNDEFSLNFTQPNIEVKPFLDLLDDEEVEFELKQNEMILNKQCTLCLDDPSAVSTFNGKNIEDNVEFFTKLNVDENFNQYFNKIKKIGNRYGKIYFILDKKKLYIETSDRKTRYSNKLRFLLSDKVDFDNIELCFDYTNMVKLKSVINNDFTMQITYIEDQELGGIYCENLDTSEKYFISSMKAE